MRGEHNIFLMFFWGAAMQDTCDRKTIYVHCSNSLVRSDSIDMPEKNYDPKITYRELKLRMYVMERRKKIRQRLRLHFDLIVFIGFGPAHLGAVYFHTTPFAPSQPDELP